MVLGHEPRTNINLGWGSDGGPWVEHTDTFRRNQEIHVGIDS
jgi:hypothetical protein